MNAESTTDNSDGQNAKTGANPFCVPGHESRLKPHPRWWVQVAQVRLRFILIVVFVGVIVGQWSTVRSVWDRWIWSISPKQATGSVSNSHEYFCPMDPGVISVWPAICPICNMDLVPRKKMEAVMLPEGIVARMQFSPYRIQLAGIRTAVVQLRPLMFEQTFTGVLRQSADGSIGFDVSLSPADQSLFQAARTASVRTHNMPESIPATVHLVDETEPPRLRIVLDDPTSMAAGSIVEAFVSVAVSDTNGTLAVPESAVIDRGRERLVYVETMPGTFDGVSVELGRRYGGYYSVNKGLTPGQRVASAGAFLIDAETRLNPSLVAGYFGANQNESRITSPPAAVSPQNPPLTKPASPNKPQKTLSREDQSLADKQRICPVTELPLNSMGGPVPVVVAGRKVFICCAGCEQKLKTNPEKYFARLLTK